MYMGQASNKKSSDELKRNFEFLNISHNYHRASCHSTLWDRVQGPLNWENYQHFWEIGENCTPFKQRIKLLQ